MLRRTRWQLEPRTRFDNLLNSTVYVQRRCLYAKNDMKKGQVIKAEDIDVLRPALGIPPKYKELIVGKTINKDIPARDPIFWEDI